MKTAKPAVTKSAPLESAAPESAPPTVTKPAAKSPKAPDVAGERDRRGKLLPPRQRVGGIITPQ